jgi:hypothetical protein
MLLNTFSKSNDPITSALNFALTGELPPKPLPPLTYPCSESGNTLPIFDFDETLFQLPLITPNFAPCKLTPNYDEERRSSSFLLCKNCKVVLTKGKHLVASLTHGER